MGFELPNGKTARNIQEQVKFLTEKLKELYAAVNKIGIRVLVVEELPEEGAPATIYLVPAEDPDQGNVYNEYMWIEDEWELIGSTAIDLSDYAQLSGNNTFTGDNTFRSGIVVDTGTGSTWSLVNDSDWYLGINENGIRMFTFTPDAFIPRAGQDLGENNNKWKDLYLSGKASFSYTGGSDWTIERDNAYNLSFYYGGSIKYSFQEGQVLPRGSNQNLGSGSFFWNHLYISEINFGTNANITKDSSNRVVIQNNGANKVKVGANETYFANHVEPDLNNTYDLGRSGMNWRDLYLSRNLTDGTNSVSVAQLASGIGGTYRHIIYIEGATADINIAVNLNSATAITTQAALANINENVMGGTAFLDNQGSYKVVIIDSVGTVGSIVYLDDTGQHTLNIVSVYQDVVNQI